VPRPTKPFIPPGSMNWYQPRLGVNVLCAAILAAGLGAMGLTRRRPVCAAPCVVLICSLPTCGAVLVRDISVSVTIQKAETLTF
jgi:hypothetical protein